MLTISAATARRLAVTKQRLAGRRPTSSPDEVLACARDLRCIQIDPIEAVARSQTLVLWSRLQDFEQRHLDAVVWERKDLFHYWAHAASLVLTEDFPIFRAQMRRFLAGGREWERRTKAWIADNASLRRHILRRLRAEGPLRSRDIQDKSVRSWRSTGWTAGKNVGRMLDLMWISGEITIAGRDGVERLWDLSERWFPDHTPRRPLGPVQLVTRCAEISLRRLGVATPQQIRKHFTRDDYPGLDRVLQRLLEAGTVVPVEVSDGGSRWPGRWLIHRSDLPTLDDLDDTWEPRTSLLSPFDNLICDRARTERVFDFNYRIEIYVPKAERRFGYYALPVLFGDRFVARLDARVDRAEGALVLNQVHPEVPNTPREAVSSTVAEIDRLAGLTGVSKIRVPASLPRGWAGPLRALG
ncbi:MAG TPA: crosslink repair DNA glycosylase YcaQ family protein [Actinomycetota bacterium]|nr:crosslink repair DNA glycosylase YcaQ family protein [Actinomycetota bacterium]